MVKAEWGAKHTCGNCEAKFYDLQQPTAVCPSCETAVPKTPVRASRSRAVKKPVVVAKPAAKEESADNEIDEDGGAVAVVESADDDDGDDSGDETIPDVADPPA